jgi:hypothetical protein
MYVAGIASLLSSAHAQEAPTQPPSTPAENPPGTTSQGREAVPPETQNTTEAASDEIETGLKAGIDVYYGISNLEGQKRFRDGFWIGYGTAYPSVVYARYGNRQGATAKVSLGIGRLYNGSELTVDQPVEAWFQKPAKGLSLTAGKFYVPFELQEWQYETKWGVMLQKAQGAYDLTGSVNYNFNTDKPNVYGRLARKFGERATVGFSLGAGRGLSFDSTHDKAFGVDASMNYRGFQLLAAYMGLRGVSEGAFNFGFAKVSYPNLGRFTPYISRHQWKDRSDQLGTFRGTTLGTSYQLTRNIALDGAFATAPGKNVRWLQIHWTQER